MQGYYSKRAKEYEMIYHRDDPIRKGEILKIKNELESYFLNKCVLEIACGTGYWTESISKVAKETIAMDYSSEVIDIAKSKKLNAKFIIDDAYKMETITEKLDGGCANFWFSHIPKNKIQEFILTFHQKLKLGSKVFIADSVYIEGLGGELIKKVGDKNTYKKRKLSDGSYYEIIKNYYNENELKDIFKKYANNMEIEFGNCFWWIKYNTK